MSCMDGLTIRLTAEQAEGLAEVAAEQDRSRGAIVRSLVGAYLHARAESEEKTDDG